MADDSLDIVEPFDFHPCNSPRGMLYYDLRVLTIDQQLNLNDLKRETVRENEKYLARHPEVRALTALITRHVLLHRPRTDLHEFVGAFFSRPRPDILEEMEQYIRDREPHVYEGDSAVIIRKESSEESVYLEEEEEEEVDLEALPRQLLDEILQRTYKQLGIDVDGKGGLKPSVSETSTSIVKSVISDILKNVDKVRAEKHDVLKYLLAMEMDQQEEEAAAEVSHVSKQPMGSASELTFEVEQTPTELEATTASEEAASASEGPKELEVIGDQTEEPTEPSQVEVTEGSEIKQETTEEQTQESVDATQQEQNVVSEEAPQSEEQATASELGEASATQPEAVEPS